MARSPRHMRPGLGDLPEQLRRERMPRDRFEPNAGLGLDWVNRYRALNFTVNIGTASQTLLQENGLRTYLLIQVLSPVNRLFFSFNSEAIAGASPFIFPEDDYELIGGEFGGSFVPRSSINVVASGPGTTVAVIEGSLDPYIVDRLG